MRPDPLELDWNDLRICLAIDRCGTVSAAAQVLGVSHSTLLRRIADLEKRLGLVVFRRKARGYEPNAAGRILIDAAGAIEKRVSRALDEVTDVDGSLRGRIVLSVPDLSGDALLALVREFSRAYRDISIEFEVSHTVERVTSGNAHVALVLTDAAPPGQVGVPIGPTAFAAYVRAEEVDEAMADRLPWIGFAPTLSHVPSGRFDRAAAARFRDVHRFGSVALHGAAIRNGLGVGLLACGIADADPDLVRVGPVVGAPDQKLWLIHRRELRGSARVVAFFRFLRRALLERADAIGGARPLHDPLCVPALREEASPNTHNG